MNIEKLKDQFYEERSNYFNKYQKLYSEYCENNEYTNKIQNENIQAISFNAYLKNCPKCNADKSVLCQPKLKIFDEHPFLNVNSTLF